ncbi:rhodanese-like domain-containing protein [Arcticibacter sp.]|jgi:rhodanese-related sulfurtransferase|uniref:rhodanese-like domain-containing protein n=1 Tax=Arcticibacter sp. TaxID=1872630 RepID=UPI00388D2C43
MKVFVSLLFTILLTTKTFAQQQDVVTVRDFRKGIKKEHPIILDVRSPEEYAEGHIKNALNLNWQNPDEFATLAARMQKSKPVYIYCRSGVRSAKAAEWLRSNGFTHIVGLDGGIKAWLDADKRVVK